MHILMLFLDGIGLGDDDPLTNPFAIANTPTLHQLANGHRWLRDTGKQQSARSVFIPTDPRLGMPGRPQSATGQATILTGRNVPQIIGEHYGPKPNAPIREIIAEDNFFKQVVAHGLPAALIEAYPPRWHKAVNSGKILRSSYQLAAHEASLPIFEEDKIYSGEALAVDWTNEGWRSELGYTDSPVYTPHEAGHKLVEISRKYTFAFHSHWITDVIGHKGSVEDGVRILELFDGVMVGALEAWEDDEGLIIITSDHGNMEEIGNRKHTENDVPTVVIGSSAAEFADDLKDLSDLVPHMADILFSEPV